MGYLCIDFLKPYLETYRVFVETGTLYGNSTSIAAPYFDHIYTIELDMALYTKASARFRHTPNVQCIYGDSKEVLPNLLPTLPKSGAVFYLDAHWSGDHTVDWEHSLWKGCNTNTAYAGISPSPENQVPLLGELTSIVAHYPGPAVVYVDDMDKFDKDGNGTSNFKFVGEDWTHLSVALLKSAVASRLVNWKVLSDEQLIIELSALGN